MNDVLLACQQLSRVYQDGQRQLQVLNQVDLQIQQGDMVAIVGSSGSGKSTLLHCLGGLDQPSSGAVTYRGQAITQWSPNQLADWRNQALGFVYQFHHLLPEFNALENVAMPQLIAGHSQRLAMQRAAEMLAFVGLSERQQHRPAELSGGERQRVAIARALVNQPQLVLADEPTGNLDAQTAEQIYALMQRLNQQLGTAFVIVTHDQHLAHQLPRVLHLHRGQLQAVASEQAAC
ncbi:lipoprotein-releasing ABC transporter ATP-binding protein LolD [Pseudidiomarina mangrovi]|uniref:lipoprotein-releasing ABC transporter ATP-binding protein LolD n=1 Tax=Pseudidiomarina mangrovi TaxID=2487133 RepID=UPI000FCB46E3|nr:lipoprotein-releasing ABC transporter ATP-binding protein LolD [Pseudidiomarina mangrovi]